MRPTHFFLIDVSAAAVASGATAAVCSSIARCLDELPGGERTQVRGINCLDIPVAGLFVTCLVWLALL
jgi:protein transport protein SEC24